MKYSRGVSIGAVCRADRQGSDESRRYPNPLCKPGVDLALINDDQRLALDYFVIVISSLPRAPCTSHVLQGDGVTFARVGEGAVDLRVDDGMGVVHLGLERFTAVAANEM